MGAKFSQIINRTPPLPTILSSALKSLKTPEEPPLQPRVIYSTVSKDSSVKPNEPKKGVLLVDSSNIKLETAQELYNVTSQSDFRFIDLPVSPGVVDAAAHTLPFMAVGDKRILTPFYFQSDTKYFYCGAQSNQVAKLCNHLISSGSYKSGVRPGLDPKLIMDIVKVSVNNLNGRKSMCKLDSQNFRDEGFMVKLIANDLSLAAAKALTGSYPMAMLNREELYKIIMIYRNLVNKDFSVVYQVLQDCRK